MIFNENIFEKTLNRLKNEVDIDNIDFCKNKELNLSVFWGNSVNGIEYDENSIKKVLGIFVEEFGEIIVNDKLFVFYSSEVFYRYESEGVSFFDIMISKGSKLRENKDFLIRYITRKSALFLVYFASDTIKNDKEFVMKAVGVNGYALKFASERLKKDKEVVMRAVENYGFVLKYACEILKNDKDVVMEAVKNNGYALEHTSETLRNDKEIVMEAVKSEGSVLKYTSETVKNEKDIVLEAVKNNVYAIKYASKTLKKDVNFIKNALDINPELYGFISSPYYKNVIIDVLKINPARYNYFLSIFKHDKEFVIECVKKNGLVLKYFSETQRNDKEIVMEALKQNALSLTFASNRLNNDKDFLILAIRYNIKTFEVLNEKMKMDKEIIIETINQDRSYINKIFQNDKLKSDDNLVKFIKDMILKIMKDIKFLDYEYVFEGNQNNFVFQGVGKLLLQKKGLFGYVNNSILIYDGQFKNGMKNGSGKLYFVDKLQIKYYGYFLNDKKHGSGVEYDINGNLIKRGKWNNDEIELEFKLLNEVKEIDRKLIESFENDILDDYKNRKLNIIGRGASSTVYKYKNMAYKHYNESDIYKTIFLERFERQVEVLSKLNHKNILKIIGISYISPMLIVMELGGKTIAELIDEYRGNIKLIEKSKILYQCSLGMTYLNQKKIFHRDLKWENVLITHHPFRIIKIIDFDTSKFKESFKLSKKDTCHIGSPCHISPEVVDGDHYSYSCDVFSFGIMIHELLFETIDPYDIKNHKERKGPVLLHLVGKFNLRPEIPNNQVNDENKWLVELMIQSYQKNPKKRPTFSDITERIKSNCPDCTKPINI